MSKAQDMMKALKKITFLCVYALVIVVFANPTSARSGLDHVEIAGDSDGLHYKEPMQIPLVKPRIIKFMKIGGNGTIIVFEDKNIGETSFRILKILSTGEPDISSLEGWTEIGRKGSHQGPTNATFLDDWSVDIPQPTGQQVNHLQFWYVIVAKRGGREAVSLPKKMERFSVRLFFDKIIIEKGRLRLRWNLSFDTMTSYRVQVKRRHPWEAKWVRVADLPGANRKGAQEYIDTTGQWASPFCYRLETHTNSSIELQGEICVDKGSKQHPEIPGVPKISNTHWGINAYYKSEEAVKKCYFELRIDNGEYQEIKKPYRCNVPLDDYRRPGQQYCLLLVVKGSGLTYSARELCGTWPKAVKPNAPTDLRVRDKTDHSVALEWHDNHAGEYQNFIRRRFIGVVDDWSIVHEEREHIGQKLSWVDETVIKGRKYEYQAGAVAKSGARAFSNRVTVNIPGVVKTCDDSLASDSAQDYPILLKNSFGCGEINIIFANNLDQAKQCAQRLFPDLSFVNKLCNYTLVPTSSPPNYTLTEISNLWAASKNDAISCAKMTTCSNCTFEVTKEENCIQ